MKSTKQACLWGSSFSKTILLIILTFIIMAKINKDQEVAAAIKANSQLAANKIIVLTVSELEQLIEFHKKEESGPLFKGTKILDILLQLKKDKEDGKEIDKDIYKKDLEAELEIMTQNIKDAIDFGGLE